MYYPLSQITPNLYTNGGEYINTVTQENYIGYYFKTSKGEFFTGRNNNDKPNIPLAPFVGDGLRNIDTPNDISFSIYNVDSLNVLEYLVLNNKTVSEIQSVIPGPPLYNPQQPTQQDYQIGEFRRYFCKKTNEYLYIEINQEQYAKLVAKDPQISWDYYQPFFIDWQLTGDKQQVAKVNRNATELVAFRNKFFGLNEYLKFDFTKYYQ